MASQLTRLSRNRKLINITAAVSRLFIRSSTSDGGSSEWPPKTPPVTKVSGPEWEDRGWKDDGTGLGDYPNLPPISAQLKDPYKVYWDQQDRRNFGEPLHEDDDALNRWMFDNYDHATVTPSQMLFQLLLAFGVLGVVIGAGEIYEKNTEPLLAPKEYPYDHLYLELGGDPDKDPSTQPKGKILHPAKGY